MDCLPGQSTIAALVESVSRCGKHLPRIAVRYGDIGYWRPKKFDCRSPMLPTVGAPKETIWGRCVCNGWI